MQARLILGSLLGAAMLFSAGVSRADRIDKKAIESASQKDRAPTFDEARERAQKSHKTLVLEFGARWCGPCKEFEQRVIPQPTVQRALSSVHFVHYDAEVAPGQSAARSLHIVGYPTFVAIGQDGRVIDRLEGYQSARQFIEWLGRVAIDFESDDTIQVRLQRNAQDAEALLVLGRRQAQRGQDAEAEATFGRAVTAAKGKSDPLAATADFELRVVKLRRQLREGPRKEMAEHLVAFPRSQNAEAAFHELTRRGPADALTLRAIERYIDVRLEDLAKNKDQKVQDSLNEAVYACLRVSAFDAAERVAQRLLSTDEKNPLFLDTLAEVSHLRGHREQAIALSNRAVAAADKQGDAGKELRSLLLKNQARFARASVEHPAELPAELLSEAEEDALPPWERSAEAPRRP